MNSQHHRVDASLAGLWQVEGLQQRGRCIIAAVRHADLHQEVKILFTHRTMELSPYERYTPIAAALLDLLEVGLLVNLVDVASPSFF